MRRVRRKGGSATREIKINIKRARDEGRERGKIKTQALCFSQSYARPGREKDRNKGLVPLESSSGANISADSLTCQNFR